MVYNAFACMMIALIVFEATNLRIEYARFQRKAFQKDRRHVMGTADILHELLDGRIRRVVC